MAAPRKYICNFNFFQIIDNEAKAYWFGFIMADGFIVLNHNRKRLGINLSVKDKEHLELFNQHINGNYPVKIYVGNGGWSKGNRAMITIPSENIVNDLINNGLTFKKSLTLLFPEIPQHLIHHFMRGYFDGDGSISYVNYARNSIGEKKYKRLVFNCSGTKEFLQVFMKNLSISDKGLYKEKRRETNTWCLKYAGNQRCNLIFDFLYEDATIYLNRKYEVFMQQRCSTTTIEHPTI